MSEKAMNELNERRAVLLAQIERAVEQLCEVIQTDIVGFAIKAVRRAFIEDTHFAQSQSDEALKDFKARLHAFVQGLAQSCSERLRADMDLWLGEDVAASEGKTLEANARVWAILAEISPSIARFMHDAGLHGEIAQYKTPMYFIDGKFAPGIIEKYWASLASLRALDQEIEQDAAERLRDEQASRWDNL